MALVTYTGPVSENEAPKMVRLVVELPAGTTFEQAVKALRQGTLRAGREQQVPAPNADHMELPMYPLNGADFKRVDTHNVRPEDGQEVVGRWYVEEVESEGDR